METLIKEGALGSVLFRSDIITEEDIKAALEEQKKTGCRFGEALVKLGIVTQEDIDWALSNQLNIPYVRLKPDMIDKRAVELVPASLARKYNLIPIFRDGDELSIALADPLNRAAIEAVEQLTGCRAIVSMPIIRELRDMLDIFYGPADDQKTFGFSSPFFPAKILESINKDTGGARFLDFMLLYIIKNKLSSISLQPLGDVVSVIGKQSQLTKEIGRLATDYYPDLLMYVRKHGKIKSFTDISAKGALEFLYNGEKVHFQVLTLKGQSGDYVTLKIHVPFPFPRSLRELGLSEEKTGAFREIASARQGMVLFSSGSMEACFRMIDLFLEEYDTTDKTVMILGEGTGQGNKRFPHISFRKDLKGEMESAVAAVLEHDPDVLVFEDVTDKQSFITAARAAMRGKLVLCGISCRDTVEVLEYLMRFQQDSSLLSHIRGIVSFRVGVVPCADCTQVSPPGGGGNSVQAFQPSPGYRPGPGCSMCGYTGFGGKKYLADVIPFTGDVMKVLSSAGEAGEVLEHMEGKGYSGTLKEWNKLLQAGAIVPDEFVTSVEN